MIRNDVAKAIHHRRCISGKSLFCHSLLIERFSARGKKSNPKGIGGKKWHE